MIKNAKLLREFEDRLIREEKPDLHKNLKIIDGLHELAVTLGAFPLRDPLEGIETDIKIAKAINSV